MYFIPLTVTTETITKLNEFKDTIDGFANIILAFGLVSSVLILIIHFIRLGGSESNPMQRNKVLKDIATTLVITALMGSVGLISKIVIYLVA